MGVNNKVNVLLVDDQPQRLLTYESILSELGHSVDFVGTGEAAVEAAGRGYDVVLMDVTLSGLDGIAATQRIRALEGDAARTPIIGISGRGEEGNEAAARHAGMDDYLVKPVSPSTLARVLAERSR